MNICYVNPTNNIRRPLAELATILSKQGHHITIIYPSSKDCPTENWVANQAIKNPQIKTVPINSKYFAPLRYSFPNLFQLFKETKKALKENDKVHVWEYYYPLSLSPLFLSLFSSQNRKKIILTTDGFVGYSYKPKEPRWLVPAFKIYTQLLARFLFKIPSLMTTYGNSMLNFAKKAGVPLHKLKVISTGIDLNKFQNIDEEKVKKIKKEFNLHDEKIILYVGMLTERKGIDVVIKVSQKLLAEGIKIKTLLVGDAHGKNKFASLVAPNYNNLIIFTGGRKDIPELMKMADVLLLPSEGEGLPGVVMEAMASGLPVVATNEGCTPDLIESGKEGFLVDLNDKENYYHKTQKILLDKRIRENFSKNGKNKIKKFNWEIVSQQYLSLYQK